MTFVKPKIRREDTKSGTRFVFMCEGCSEEHAVNSAWQFNGSYESPTFLPSIRVVGSQRISPEQEKAILKGEVLDVKQLVCHSYITNGMIEFLSDCTHDLAGQTFPLPIIQPKQ